jgi:hypothetical protein
MKNKELTKLVKEILTTPNITVEKGTVGGASIEVFVKTPYEDKGSLLYKNDQDRDNDFDELQTILKTAKETENVG